ncbi:MAG: hypothetical protein U1A27_13775 [Phycisphaerae bacterium]
MVAGESRSLIEQRQRAVRRRDGLNQRHAVAVKATFAARTPAGGPAEAWLKPLGDLSQVNEREVGHFAGVDGAAEGTFAGGFEREHGALSGGERRRGSPRATIGRRTTGK